MTEEVETLAGCSVLHSLLVLDVIDLSANSDYESKFDKVSESEKLLVCGEKSRKQTSLCLVTTRATSAQMYITNKIVRTCCRHMTGCHVMSCPDRCSLS